MVCVVCMKKIFIILLCASFASIFLCACNTKPQAPMIKSERRFAKYLGVEENSQQKNEGVIDLSEGPKLKYDAHFGPKNPDFDFKIETPY